MVNAQQINAAAAVLKKELPGLGFALIAFDFGEGEREFRYISNCQREDMIQALEAVLNKWKNHKPQNN